MPSLNLRLTDQQHERLSCEAMEAGRSLQRHIVWRLFAPSTEDVYPPRLVAPRDGIEIGGLGAGEAVASPGDEQDAATGRRAQSAASPAPAPSPSRRSRQRANREKPIVSMRVTDLETGEEAQVVSGPAISYVFGGAREVKPDFKAVPKPKATRR